MAEWFGASWSTVAWVAASTGAMYATVVIAVRVAGRRTLTQLSAFDIVVTIAIGSIVATTSVQRTASYAQGATAIVTLLAMQTLVGACRQRFPFLRRVLDFTPQVVVREGRMNLSSGPLGPQLTETELLSRLRQQGVFSLDGVHIVVLEPTGEVSVSRGPVPEEERWSSFE